MNRSTELSEAEVEKIEEDAAEGLLKGALVVCAALNLPSGMAALMLSKALALAVSTGRSAGGARFTEAQVEMLVRGVRSDALHRCGYCSCGASAAARHHRSEEALN